MSMDFKIPSLFSEKLISALEILKGYESLIEGEFVRLEKERRTRQDFNSMIINRQNFENDLNLLKLIFYDNKFEILAGEEIKIFYREVDNFRSMNLALSISIFQSYKNLYQAIAKLIAVLEKQKE